MIYDFRIKCEVLMPTFETLYGSESSYKYFMKTLFKLFCAMDAWLLLAAGETLLLGRGIYVLLF